MNPILVVKVTQPVLSIPEVLCVVTSCVFCSGSHLGILVILELFPIAGIYLVVSSFYETFIVVEYSGTMAHQLEIRPRRHCHCYIRGCYATSMCFKNFLDLDNHLLSASPSAIYELLHENCSRNFVPTIPDTFKYRNYLIDLMEFCVQHYFNNDDFTCDLDVNLQGHNKVYTAWRVLDRYRGRWGHCSVTRNVVDIIVNIPEWNVQVEHHLCFQYFNHSRGSPETDSSHYEVSSGCIL